MAKAVSPFRDRGPEAPAAHLARGWWAALRRAAEQVGGSDGQVTLNLALQGGGAHGAYTWGVLDALLAQPRLAFEGISGSSAGAMNAVVLAHGWLNGEREGARKALADFWGAVGQQMPALAAWRDSEDVIELSSAARMMTRWAQCFSPAQLNPFDLNPLRDILQQQVDFARLRRQSAFKLFIGATAVDTGQLRLFREHELTVEVLLASACLPRVHHTIMIDGRPYWDGGFSANPAVFPLLHHCRAQDVLLVLLNPGRHDTVPRHLNEIEGRITELAFTAHFFREMRGLAEARSQQRPPYPRFHQIDTLHLAGSLQSETKVLAHGPFLDWLHDEGQRRTQAWLAEHQPALGRRSTLDLEAYL